MPPYIHWFRRDRFVHRPWTMPEAEQRRANSRIGRDCPAPIVDHAIQRERALRQLHIHESSAIVTAQESGQPLTWRCSGLARLRTKYTHVDNG